MFKAKDDQQREVVISKLQWDQLQADVKAIRSKQQAHADLAIDLENRFAKLDAKQDQKSHNFAKAIDQLDTRTANLINASTQLMGRLDDVSALARRIDRTVDAHTHWLDAFNAKQSTATAQRIEGADALSQRIETLAMESDAKVGALRHDAENHHKALRAGVELQSSIFSGRLDELRAAQEQFRLDTQHAIEVVRADSISAADVQGLDALRFDMGNLADEIGKRHGELAERLQDTLGLVGDVVARIDEIDVKVGELPNIAKQIKDDVREMKDAITAVIGIKDVPLADAPKVPTLAEIMAMASAPSVEDVLRMQAASAANGAASETKEAS